MTNHPHQTRKEESLMTKAFKMNRSEPGKHRGRCAWTTVLLAAAIGVAPRSDADDAQAIRMRHLDAYRMAGTVVIDGRLDEAAWRELPEYSGFKWNNAPDRYAGVQSTVQVGYDDAAIYIGFQADEPRLREHLVHAREKDVGEIKWDRQLIELFISPPTELGPQPFQFAVDILGYRSVNRAKLDGKPYERGVSAWQPADLAWEAAVTTNSAGYRMEVRIPFESLGAFPTPGDRWLAHIGRHGTWSMDDLPWQVSQWSALNPTKFWNRVDQHAFLTFTGGRVEPGRAHVLTQAINAEFHAWQLSDGVIESLLALTQDRPNLLETIDRAELTLDREAWQSPTATQPWRRRAQRMPQGFLIAWKTPVTFNAHRVDWDSPTHFATAYALEYDDGKQWHLAYATCSNRVHRSLHRFDPVTAVRVRLTLIDHRPGADLALKHFGLYRIETKDNGVPAHE